MNRIDPSDFAKWTNGAWQCNELPEAIAGFCFDARKVQVGECFVALSGGMRDGHEFAAQAIAGGASALIVEQLQAVSIPQLVVDDSLVAMGAIAANVRASFSGAVVGITGSCGKTSTKEMLRVLLGEDCTHATAGNWNNRIGVPMTLFGLDRDTHDYAVIEAGINQPSEMAELGAMIHADLTVVTNIAAAHLELLGSLETVAAEKSELMLRSREGAPVVLPNSVLQYASYASNVGRALVVAAEDEAIIGAPAKVTRYRVDHAGDTQSMLTLTDASGTESFNVASPSDGICVNAALAIVAARELGIVDTLIRERIATWMPTADRGRIVTQGTQTFYIDCYNANPASMCDAISAFCRATSSSQARCYALGVMNELGADASDLHQSIGRHLKLSDSDRLLLVGPEELTRAYADGALEAGAAPEQIMMATSVERLKPIVAEFSGAVFLKGSRSYALETLLPSTVI